LTKCCSKDTVKVLFADMTVNKSKAYIEALPKNTLEIVKKYDTLKKMNGCTQKTRRNYIRLMLQFAKETGKPFDKISKDDIDTFIVKRNGNTLEQYKLDIKAFFTWFGKLELVSHLKHLKQAEKLTPQMMWTEEEYLSLLNLVDPTTKERDQCILMLLWDLGAEKSVIENLKIKDIYEADGKLMIKVTGKKRRQIKEFVMEAIYSAPYIRRWLNVHPNGSDIESPFFCQLENRSFGKQIHDQFVWRLVRKVGKRSNVKKRLYPYLIRHSRATDLAKKGITGDTLAYRMRHSNLQIQQRYKHLHNEVHENRIYEADTGIKRTDMKTTKRPLMQVSCPKCSELNDPINLYCKSCEFILNNETARMEIALLEMMRSKWFINIQKSIKEIEKKQKIPYEKIEPNALLQHYLKTKETVEERNKRVKKEIKALVE